MSLFPKKKWSIPLKDLAVCYRMYGLFKLQCKSIVIDVKGEENLCVRFFNKKDFYALDTAVHPCSLL